MDRFASLCKDINELRNTLNEMSVCLLTGSVEDNLEILNISKKLDELIKEYYSLIKILEL
jgi:hypothetical protein